MIIRRNSTIQFIRINKKEAVLKKYHATYGIQEEFQKIQELSEILNYSERFRCVEVIKAQGDELILEKINGFCLGSLGKFQIEALTIYKEEIIELFLRCNKLDFSFDSDLSNLFFSSSDSQFIFIDPVQEDLKIDHLSFVVFTLSIVKSIGKSKNILLVRKKIICFNEYFMQYSNMGNIEVSDLKQSFLRYIDVIIQWNIGGSVENNLGVKLLRRFILIPIWRLIKSYIKNLNIHERN